MAIEVPANVRQAPPPPPVTVAVEKLADGVWYLSTPNARSWAVEFNDHVVLVEGMAGEARSLAINAEIAKLVPNKPLALCDQHPRALRSRRRACAPMWRKA